ncbi:pyridoxal phosphate-dependent aminotransferase [Vibrio sp. DW001]|uniref:MalY/PatB family protein n=1 Tax=Vibrio sp. DW001 TaxID=2912315 RepID=UPI0023AF67EF|nr:MalY/PatB family protein [Vibrio sp. DW001]WED29334.1 pyridoxal phosphate-dependent aminotransferase [Vibrio sp. DW001]
MANFNFDYSVDRKGSNSAKWEYMKKISPYANDNTLPLWVADMDFACAPEIIEAMKQRVDDQIFGYSMVDSSYYESVQNWFFKRFDWYVKTDDIYLTSGVIPALESIIRAYSNEQDGVIIQPPVYHMFAKVIEREERRIVNNPLIEIDGVYSIDFDDLEQKAKNPDNKIMFFCSPHNPTGNVWSQTDLLKLGNICLDNDVLLVSDEIHFDLVRMGVKHYPISTLFPNSDKIITCTAPSKTFNLAGLHMSNVIIESKELKDRWEAKNGFSMPSPLGIVAVTAAYNFGEPWLEELKAYIDANYSFAKAFVEQHIPQAQFTTPQGTYFIWLDLKEYNLSSKQLDSLMIKKANVLLEGGTMFGTEGEGYQRINIACTRQTLKEALTRISKALNE